MKNKMKKGWVYIISNEGFNGLVKIGFSRKDPQYRVEDFNTEASPYPYKVEFDILVENPSEVEKFAHRLLASKRENKEWFRCSVEYAIKAVKKASANFSVNISTPIKNKKILPSNDNQISFDDINIEENCSADFLSSLTLAKQNNINAQYKIGLMYQHGTGITQDYNEAINWYRKAANQGNTDAQYHLGYMLYKISWLHQDYTEALNWFSKAANQGNSEAQYFLGNMYQHGHGVTANLQIAQFWYLKAIENNDTEMKKKVISTCLGI